MIGSLDVFIFGFFGGILFCLFLVLLKMFIDDYIEDKMENLNERRKK